MTRADKPICDSISSLSDVVVNDSTRDGVNSSSSNASNGASDDSGREDSEREDSSSSNNSSRGGSQFEVTLDNGTELITRYFDDSSATSSPPALCPSKESPPACSPPPPTCASPPPPTCPPPQPTCSEPKPTCSEPKPTCSEPKPTCSQPPPSCPKKQPGTCASKAKVRVSISVYSFVCLSF